MFIEKYKRKTVKTIHPKCCRCRISMGTGYGDSGSIGCRYDYDFWGICR